MALSFRASAQLVLMPLLLLGANAKTRRLQEEGEEEEGEVVRLAVVLGCIGVFILIAVAGALRNLLPAKGPPTLLFRPLCCGWSPAGAFALALVAGCLVAVDVVAAGTEELVVGLGLGAGLAAMLPVWFAFGKAGIHSAFGLSREASWGIHNILGGIFLVLGTVHGAYAIVEDGWEEIAESPANLLGFIGMVLVWAGVLPIVAFQLLPKIVPYDAFKLLHFITMAGFVLALVHMILFGAVVLIVVNAAALFAFVLQKMYVRCTAKRVQVEGVEVLTEGDSRHIILDLHAPKFVYSAGQWAHLSVPSVSPVPHPFTVVPGSEQGRVRVIARVSGRFTAGLASAAGSLKGRRVSLEGPFGAPPVPAALQWARGVVFVLGGVGVTPALSLVPAAKAAGAQVRLFWALRSPALLRACAPMLEKQVAPGHRCVSVTAEETAGAAPLPLQAVEGRRDVGMWLSKVAAELGADGRGPVLLFVCGPPALASAVQRGAAEASEHVSWHIHVELFQFLPGLPGAK